MDKLAYPLRAKLSYTIYGELLQEAPSVVAPPLAPRAPWHSDGAIAVLRERRAVLGQQELAVLTSQRAHVEPRSRPRQMYLLELLQKN